MIANVVLGSNTGLILQVLNRVELQLALDPYDNRNNFQMPGPLSGTILSTSRQKEAFSTKLDQNWLIRKTCSEQAMKNNGESAMKQKV